MDCLADAPRSVLPNLDMPQLQSAEPSHVAVFISNADGTIVMATHAIIASEFMALESSSWLYAGFTLASTATQTTFGQLSEIYGRKPIIMLSYLVFGLGWYVLEIPPEIQPLSHHFLANINWLLSAAWSCKSTEAA